MNQHKPSHDTCFWHFMAEVNLYTTYFLKDQSKFETSVLIFFLSFFFLNVNQKVSHLYVNYLNDLPPPVALDLPQAQLQPTSCTAVDSQ